MVGFVGDRCDPLGCGGGIRGRLGVVAVAAMTFHLFRLRLAKRRPAVCALCRWYEAKPEPTLALPKCGNTANDWARDPVSGRRVRQGCYSANVNGKCKHWAAP